MLGQGGDAVSISVDTVVVGAQGDGENGPGAGAAYVYERDHGGPGNWGEVVKLLASDGAAGDAFGAAVAISADTIVVGAKWEDEQGAESGALYVFERNAGGPGNWDETKKLLASDGDADDWFGSSVAISGDTLVAGAIKKESAYVFDRDRGGAGNWGEGKKLWGGGTNDRFGGSVAIDVDTLVVGADGENTVLGADSGAAHVYGRDKGGSDNWGLLQDLLASDGGARDLFGRSVAIHGSTIAVGAMEVNAGATNTGAAYVFETSTGTSWTEQAKLVASNASADDRLGTSTAVFADRVLVGSAARFPVGAGSGAAYVFDRDLGGTNRWGESAMLFSPPSGWFHRVSISGDTLVVGSSGPYVYEFSPSACWERYGAPGVTGGGCRATLYASGIPSASEPSGFTLVSAYVEGNKDGLYFFGINGRQAVPWGDPSKGCTSVQCVAPPVKRGPLLPGVAGPVACRGNFLYDLNAHWTSRPSHNPGAGATVQAQLWFRDPQSPCAATRSRATTSLSDALEFQVAP